MNEKTGIEVLKTDVAPIVARAHALVISTPEEYALAADGLKEIKGAMKRVDAFFAPMKAANLEATRRTNEALAGVRKPLEEAEAIWKRKQTDYAMEQERIRQEQQRKLQVEADERARKERERLEKEAAKLKTPELKAARMEEAQTIVAPVVEVASTIPIVKGQAFRKTWKAYVVDAKAAAGVALTFPDWQSYVELNLGELNRFAARTKGTVKWAGIEWYEDTTIASGSR